MTAIAEHELVARTAQQMEQLGAEIGRRLQHGAVLRLEGDLGAGKTCFVKGLARGLEVPGDYPITSPTYALIHDYPGRLPLVHVDLYRIYGAADAESIGLWEFIDDRTVVAVEWAERLGADEWPASSLIVRIGLARDESRRVRLIGCGLQMAGLIQDISELASEQENR